jgi:SAM-dependent methyltransferase
MTTPQAGSASVQGDLWSARPRDWSRIQEPQFLPVYTAALESLALAPGTMILDAGCGSGRFAEMAAERGLKVTGLDAAEALLEVARGLVPGADFRLGEIEALPFDDHTFDAVTGFNSFQFAADPVAALREARRVAKPGAAVAIATWGPMERCEAAAQIATVAGLMQAAPAGAPVPFALSAPGALEAMATEAGLSPVRTEDVECTWEYDNELTAIRGFISSGPAERAVRHSGEAVVFEALRASLQPFAQAEGGFRLKNVFRILFATA